MSPEEMRLLSTLLDKALDVHAEEREAWLAALQGDAAAMAPLLREMLSKAGVTSADNPWSRGPAFTAPGETAFQSPFAAGDRVGAYRLVKPIGHGGMGEVWVAERSDGLMKRAVALKLPLLGLPGGVLAQRFEREREILARLAHPHIARLYDAGVAESGQPYLALEFVEGRHITDFCREEGIDIKARVRLVQQVIEAVQYAHANLVVHRDIKPSNVIVDASGQAKLLDFGIAKLLEDVDTGVAETELTRIGGRALTLSYAAPEQITGEAVSTATDVWALGVLLYELLTGTRPFQGDRRQLEQAILSRDAPRAAGVPADLATIVAKAMKRVPAERYPAANAVAQELDRWMGGLPVLAQPDSAWYRTRKFVARNLAATVAAAGVFVTVVAASGVSIHQAQVAREQTRIARDESRTAQAVQDFLESLFGNNSVDQGDPVAARAKTAEAILNEGAARIQNTLEDQPKSKLRILTVLADLYSQMDQSEKEQALAERRVELAARAFPGATDEHIQALATLAISLAYNGSEAEAKARIGQAQALLAENPGAGFESRMLVQRTLVELQRAAGSSDLEALEDARRLVAMFEGRPPSKEQFRALFLKGERERVAGRDADAIRSLRAALEIEQRVPGGIAGGLGMVHLELGEAQSHAGDLAGSEASRRTALRLSESAGPTSQRVMTQKSRLASFLSENGKPKEALPLLADVASRLPEISRDPIAQTLAARGISVHTARTLWRVGRPEEALAKQAALRAFQTHAVDEPVGEIALAAAEARSLIDLGRLKEARASLERADALRQARRMTNAGVVRELGFAQMALAAGEGGAAEAEAVWKRLLADHPPSRSTIDAVESEILWARNEPAAAGTRAAQALAEMMSRPPDEGAAFNRFRLQLVLARSLLAQSRPGDALGHLRSALAWNAEACDASMSPERLAALVVLAEVELALGHPSQARTALSEAVAIRHRHPALGLQYTVALQAALRHADQAKVDPAR